MATLLPSLASDDEEDLKNLLPETVNNDDDDDESDDDGEVNKDFVFGGILGEDGGMFTQEGWSYQTALDSLEQSKSKTPARMDVSSLIEAKRQNLKEQKAKLQQEKQIRLIEKNGKTQNKKDDTESESSSSSDDDDEEDDDDEVDDANRKDLEEDILKTRIGNSEQDETKRKKKSQGNNGDDENENNDESGNDEEEEEDDDNSEEDDNEHNDNNDDSDSDEEDEDEEEAAKAAAFFDTIESEKHSSGSKIVDENSIEVFAQLTLSRPLLRGVAAMGYVKPTKIQSAVIPLALAGRDICASAVTGSGKTAAFLLPILERLLYKVPGRISAVILTPTRELAAQCIGMMSTLAQFTKLQSTLIVGGAKNVQAQMAELRARPQIVVATPGRLLDHVMNSPGVSLDDVNFLVLDEADRLLDLGFQEEVQELVKACPKERQTLLFSATMNTKVDDLISLSMKRPVRIRISDSNGNNNNNSSNAPTSGKDLEVAPRLEQEFVRVRESNEGINREGMLLALLTRTFSKQTIVFFDTKVKAHRMMILCGLCGIKCAELHGNLTQTQRLQALEQFRTGEVDILLATDLAARGLDIDRVEAVVNFEMPNQIETYIHRIGRTARAGRGGKSCTLIGEGRRHLMKEIIKDAAGKKKHHDNDKKKNNNNNNKSSSSHQSGVIRSRSIPPAVVVHFVKKIQSLEPHVEEVLQAETVAKMDRLAEMELTKAQNIIEHEKDIQARPKREWFASNKDKEATKMAAAEKAKMIAEKVGTGTHRMTRKKRRAREARERLLQDQQEAAAAADNDGDGDVGQQQQHGVPKLPSFKGMAKAAKKEQQQKQKKNDMKSLHDVDMEKELAIGKKKRKLGKGDALGDSSLFSEEKTMYAPKKKKSEEEERAPSNYHFRGFNAALDGKKVKKKGTNKFKSKSKYKRRKK